MGMCRADNELAVEGSLVTPHRARRRRPASVVALGAVLLLASLLYAPAAQAATFSDLHGTFAETFVPTNVRVVGSYTFLTLQNTGVFQGSLNGTSSETATATVYPDGTTKVLSRGTCQCTFADRSGEVRFVVSAEISPTGIVQGQIWFFGASGELSRLAGDGSFEGLGNVVVLSGRLILP